MSTLGDRPAFPCPELYATEGMSLRAYLAGQALTGVCASTELYDERTPVDEQKNNLIINQVAKAAVAIADATLKELAKEGR